MSNYKVAPERNLGLTPKVKELQIPDGLAGNLKTIEFMKKTAQDLKGHPKVRELAKQIVGERHIPSNYYIQEALAIGDFVQAKVRYLRDPNGIEYLQSPVDLIEQITRGEAQGDCDDMALLTATLLLSIGHEPYFRAVRYQGFTGPYNHIYVVVYEQDRNSPRHRIVLDCIIKDKPISFEIKSASGDEFEV